MTGMRGGWTVGLALTLTACAGAVESPPPPVVAANPRAGVIAQIDQLCLDAYKKQQNVLWPQDEREAERYYERQAEIARELMEGLADVEVPEDGKQYIDEMIDQMRKIAAGYDRIAGSVGSVDDVEEESEPYEDAVHRFNVVALRYGLLECSDPRPPRVY